MRRRAMRGIVGWGGGIVGEGLGLGSARGGLVLERLDGSLVVAAPGVDGAGASPDGAGTSRRTPLRLPAVQEVARVLPRVGGAHSTTPSTTSSPRTSRGIVAVTRHTISTSVARRGRRSRRVTLRGHPPSRRSPVRPALGSSWLRSGRLGSGRLRDGRPGGGRPGGGRGRGCSFGQEFAGQGEAFVVR